jgi:hypothetical protein
MNERNGLAWFGPEIWKLRGIKRSKKKKRRKWSLCEEEDSKVDILLKCKEIQGRGKHS